MYIINTHEFLLLHREYRDQALNDCVIDTVIGGEEIAPTVEGDGKLLYIIIAP